METYDDLVRRLIKAFETTGFDYAFTGALAASFYGVPRTTTDVDVIVQVSGENAKNKIAHALKRVGVRAEERKSTKCQRLVTRSQRSLTEQRYTVLTSYSQLDIEAIKKKAEKDTTLSIFKALTASENP
jgi:hypothetical protein